MKERAVMATVLIVDDHPSSLIALECVLEPLQQDILAAGSGAAALDIVSSRELALIVTDLCMRPMSGLELIRRVRSGTRNRDVPVIVLSGLGNALPASKQLELGEVLFLEKPCEAALLAQHVRARLAS
jgi:two-component system chemotaxis response regulator CheY